MKFTDWLWTNKTPEEIRREAFKPIDELRECDVAPIAGLEAVPRPDGDSTQLDSASAAENEKAPRATAKVVLMPLKASRLALAVRFLRMRGYRLKFNGRQVEMIR